MTFWHHWADSGEGKTVEVPDPDGSGFIHRYIDGHADPKVHAVIKVFDKWLIAIESGEVQYWLPDPNFPKQYTEEEVNAFIIEIDEYVKRQWANWGSRYKGGSAEYSRMDFPQRLAMLQDLSRTLAQLDQPAEHS